MRSLTDPPYSMPALIAVLTAAVLYMLAVLYTEDFVTPLFVVAAIAAAVITVIIAMRVTGRVIKAVRERGRR